MLSISQLMSEEQQIARLTAMSEESQGLHPAVHHLDDYNQVLKKYNSNVLSDASIENLNDLVEG